MESTIVILGVTGDLARKKIIPAIYKLVLDKKLKNFAIIGVARSKYTSEELINKSKSYIKNIDNKIWNKIKERFTYFMEDFSDEKKFCKVGVYIRDMERKYNLKGDRIFYLATLPRFFIPITNNLRNCGLTSKRDKIVFEKPFGNNLKSAVDINKEIKKTYKEEQIYRIDHYLGKEIVQNISIARFTNTVLEPLWNNKYIDHIQIVMTEDFGIEDRGGFYDKYGALKDVVQNHLLQLLSLVAMETPNSLSEEDVRNQKIKVLKAVKSHGKDNIVIGQYEGYKDEKGVKTNSKTETFAAMKLSVDNKRWKGVPFYLLTGKNMKNKMAAIYIEFKQAKCGMFEKKCKYMPNYLIMQIQPNQGFYMRLNAKAPGEVKIVPVDMDFCHECKFGPNSPEAYENLLEDAIKGNQSMFVRTDEVEEQWRIIDKIKIEKLRIHTYKKKDYPTEAKRLIEKDCRSWHLEVKHNGN